MARLRRSGELGQNEIDSRSQRGGGQGDGSGGHLLLGVYEQICAYSDVGEVFTKPGGAIDERDVGGSHDDEDVCIA